MVGAAQHGVLLRRRRDLHGHVLRAAPRRAAAQPWLNRVGLRGRDVRLRLRQLPRPVAAAVLAADHPERVGRPDPDRPRHRLPRASRSPWPRPRCPTSRRTSSGTTGCFPASSIMDLLVIACTAFSLLLALMREQRGRADRRARPQGRRVGEPAPDARDRLRLDERRRGHRRQRPGLDVQRRRPPAARPPHPGRYARLLGRGLRAGRRRRPASSTTTTLREALWVDADDSAAPRRLQVLVGHDGSRTDPRPVRPADRRPPRSARRWCCCTTSPPSEPGCAS